MEITSSRLAFEFLSSDLQADTEEFWVLALGPSKKPLKKKMLFRGTVDACMVHPRDVFRFAVLENASSVLVAHNHPSGDPSPSPRDIELTESLIEAGQLLRLPIIDHLIIGGHSYRSLKDDGLITAW